MIVIIKEIIHEGRFGGAIFSATCEANKIHKIVANQKIIPRAPLIGEVWEVEGETRVDATYGPQIHLNRAVLKRPSGQLFIKSVSMSPLFPGIGSATATALYSLHQDAIYELLDNGNYEDFSKIGEHLARVLVNGWKHLSGTADTYQWLDRQGIKVSLANKIIAIYGNHAAELLEKNPYRLLAFTSWTVAEKIANKLQISKDDPRRLIAGVDEVVFAEHKRQNTWTTLPDFRSRLIDVLKCDLAIANHALELAERDRAIIRIKDGVQGLGSWSMENYIIDQTAHMLSSEFEPKQVMLHTAVSPNKYEQFFTEFEEQNQLILNDAQRDAVRMALTTPVGVLCGGAGTGKTTVLKAICEGTEKAGGQMILLALAGRAALRMTEATGREAMTIARFLNQVDRKNLSLDEGLSTVVIDESSMVDLATLYKIMRRLEPGCRLLLVGDPCQLPPISFGLAFHLLAKSSMVPRVELTEIMRQEATTGIPQFSRAICPDQPIEGDRQVPKINKYCGKKDGVYHMECEPAGLHEKLLSIVKDLGGFDKIRIITPLKRDSRPDGALAINKMLHRCLAKGRQPEKDGFCLYEPVLYTENNYELDLRNGTLGFISSLSSGIEVAWETGYQKMETVNKMERAYAINCHRCQGSQFERVIIPIFDSKILDSTMLYTAVTRAQRQVVLVGNMGAFVRAVEAPSKSSIRRTGLQFLI